MLPKDYIEGQTHITVDPYYIRYCIRCKHSKECNPDGIWCTIYEDPTDAYELYGETDMIGLECEFKAK